LLKLKFFDIDKWMHEMFVQPEFLEEIEPYDFLQPMMVQFINLIHPWLTGSELYSSTK